MIKTHINNLEKVNLMLLYKDHHIRTNTDTAKQPKITARKFTKKSNPATPNTKTSRTRT